METGSDESRQFPTMLDGSHQQVPIRYVSRNLCHHTVDSRLNVERRKNRREKPPIIEVLWAKQRAKTDPLC